MAQDITDMIASMQCFGGMGAALASRFATQSALNEFEKVFEFKDAVMVDAKPNTFSDYFRLFIKYSADNHYQGVFWQQRKDAPICGYVYDTQSGKMQVVENDKVKQSFDSIPPEEAEKYNAKLRRFNDKFRQEIEKFTTYSTEAFFEKRGRQYKKLKKS